MNAAELRQKTDEDLQKELMELLREQFNLRMQKGAGQAPRHDRFPKIRKTIARIKTIQNERARTASTS